MSDISTNTQNIDKGEIKVNVKSNGQHRRYELKDFGVNFEEVSNYISKLLHSLKAPITTYTFFVHGKSEGIDLKNFSVKMLNSKHLLFSFYKADDLPPIYGSFSGKDLSEKQMQNLFTCLKTWQSDDGDMYIPPKENLVKKFAYAKAELVEKEAEAMLKLPLNKVFTELKNAKFGTVKNELYRNITKEVIDFTKRNKKNLSRDVSIFEPSEEILLSYFKQDKKIDSDKLSIQTLIKKLSLKFSYKHSKDIKVFFTKMFLDFYKSPETFDMSLLSDKRKIWESKMLEVIAIVNVPNQGKRKYVWNIYKENDFKRICQQYSLSKDKVEDFRNLYFREDYGKLMEACKEQTIKNLEAAESLKKDLAKTKADYDSEQAEIAHLQQQVEERKKKVHSMRADISSKEQVINKLSNEVPF